MPPTTPSQLAEQMAYEAGEIAHEPVKFTIATAVESGGEVKMTKQEIIEMIERAGFQAIERDTVYNHLAGQRAV